jgi:hypothetical protein
MTCNCATHGGCSCSDENLGYFLGALTPEAAADVSFPASKVSGRAGFNQHVRDCIVQAAGSGAFACFDASGCTNSSSNNVRLAQTSAGLALTGISVGAALHVGAIAAISTALGPWTLGISALIGLFPLIFAHHAAAVAREKQVICASVPAANNTLQVIQQAVAGGQTTPQHAIDALNSLLADFTSNVTPIMKNNASQCNAACVWVKELTAIVAEITSELQDLQAQQNVAAQAPPVSQAPQPFIPARPNVTTVPGAPAAAPSSYTTFYSTPPPAIVVTPAAPTSTTDWLPIAAVIGGAFLLLRGGL